MAKRISGLKPSERLVVRSAKGRFAKFKSDRKMIFEVRDRKSGKITRYLNNTDRKTKKPIPRRFTSFQLKFLTAERTRKLQVREVRQVSIEVNSRSPVIEQLEKKGGPIIRMIRSHLRKEDSVSVYADLSTSMGERFRSPMVIIGQRWSDEQILKAIALEMVVNQLRSLGIRMSPKKYARSDKEAKRRQIKKGNLTVYVAKF